MDRRHIFKISICLIFFLPLYLAAEITVNTRFNPPRIALGDRAQYLVEITESGSVRQPRVEPVRSLPIPQTPGIQLRNGRTSSSQQTRIINGTAEYTVTQSLIFDAKPTSVGTYRIPAFSFTYKGEERRAPAATLEVVTRPADAAPSRDELVFLRTDLPEKLYVGQTVAFDLTLFVGEEVRLTGLNRFDRTADGFTISSLPEDPEEGSQFLEGRRYRTFSWPMRLTPIQTGDQPLSFEFTLTANLPGNNNARGNPFRRSPFSGSLFDDFFGRSESLNVYTDLNSIDVLPLPTEGQPPMFSGAIGEFALEIGVDSETTRAGEPVMLSVEITGEGNFDRIEGPNFPDSPEWRIYDPESQFVPDDALGLRGSKRFDYVVMPERAGSLEIPATSFSFFDPEEARYVTLEAPPIKIEVSPRARSVPVPGTGSEAGEPGAPPEQLNLSRSLTAEEALLTLDYQPKPGRSPALRILADPLFIAFNLLAGLGLAGASLGLRHQRARRNDPEYRIRRQAKSASKAAEKAAKAALASNDAATFYQEAQVAVRQAVAAHTGRPMQSAGVEDICGALRELSIDPNVCSDIRRLFAEADAQRFGQRGEAYLASAAECLNRTLNVL